MPSIERPLAEALRDVVLPLQSVGDAMAPVLNLVGEARIVMIGEASHGTHDFYDFRAEITKRLIEELDFNAVCCEADWPDAWRVNRFVRGFDDDSTGAEALAGFKRFPQWMWRNTVVLDFVNWLRRRNKAAGVSSQEAGFYGIDLYSLNSSIRAVLDYLDKTDPAAAARARSRYGCFEDYAEDPQRYGYAASFDLDRSCEAQAIAQLVEMQRHRGDYAKRDGRIAEDEHFYAEQNARLVQNAEQYYREMFHGQVSSWNLRDRHMAETIDALIAYMDRHGRRTKAVIWAHNSHLGDARATEMSRRGEWNVGQLVRERWKEQACNIGFSTYAGTVTAADDWDDPAETMRVRPGLPGSYEELFHESGMERFLLRMKDATELRERLRGPLLQRAIGVIYRPRTERMSHYFRCHLTDQFDAMIHLDETSALVPLDRRPSGRVREVEETYPTGI